MQEMMVESPCMGHPEIQVHVCIIFITRKMVPICSERCFQLVLITQSFTRSLPARIQRLT